MTTWPSRRTHNTVVERTSRGFPIEANFLIIAAGSWLIANCWPAGVSRRMLEHFRGLKGECDETLSLHHGCFVAQLHVGSPGRGSRPGYRLGSTVRARHAPAAHAANERGCRQN